MNSADRTTRSRLTSTLLMLTLLISGGAIAAEYQTLDWLDLLTEADREAMLNLPPIDHGAGDDPLSGGSGAGASDGDLSATEAEPMVSLEEQIAASLARQAERTPAQQAAEAQWQAVLTNDRVRQELDGSAVRLPGFVVPLQTAADGKVTEFFLVPYFGACIHVPPPPPNQIVHVNYPAGYDMPDLYTPVWISGTLHTATISNAVADSAYRFDARAVEIYQE